MAPTGTKRGGTNGNEVAEPAAKFAKEQRKTPPAQQATQGTTAPASGGVVAGDAAGSAEANVDKCKQATLLISGTAPFRPRMPTQEEIISGTAPSVRSYMQNLKIFALTGSPCLRIGASASPPLPIYFYSISTTYTAVRAPMLENDTSVGASPYGKRPARWLRSLAVILWSNGVLGCS